MRCRFCGLADTDDAGQCPRCLTTHPTAYHQVKPLMKFPKGSSLETDGWYGRRRSKQAPKHDDLQETEERRRARMVQVIHEGKNRASAKAT